MRRSLAGILAALGSMAVLTGAMLPLRSHLSVATTALILVIPVVIGVVVGGFGAGVVSVTAGFLVYDFFFIKPYLTLWVGAPENWAALGVYVIVMIPVAVVVAGLKASRAKERQLSGELTEVFGISGLLLQDKPLTELLDAIVSAVADVFAARQVALLLAAPDGRLKVAAAAGEPLSGEQLSRVLPEPGTMAHLTADPAEQGDLVVLALTASQRPVGLLTLSAHAAGAEREPLRLFANQIALAVERAQLRDQVLQTRLTQEVSRLARTLVAAVSHDLRAPLATIKASSSTLADAGIEISDQSRHDLAKIIDAQADRLADLVQNLLDMSRIQAGVLQPRCTVTALTDLVNGVVQDLKPQLREHLVQISFPPEPPLVNIDAVLIARVLTNLIENAIRHGPKGTPITIRVTVAAEHRTSDAREDVEVSVTDHGRGISLDRRDEIFGLLMRRPGDSGAGLGLFIAKTFIEAHGQRIWLEDAEPRGTRFCFTLPIAQPRTAHAQPEENHVAAGSHH